MHGLRRKIPAKKRETMKTPPQRFVPTEPLYTAYHDALAQEHFFLVPWGNHLHMYGAFVQHLPEHEQVDKSGFIRDHKVIVKHIILGPGQLPVNKQRGVFEFKIQVWDNPMRAQYLPDQRQKKAPVELRVNSHVMIPGDHEIYVPGILAHLRDWLPMRFKSVHPGVATQWHRNTELKRRNVTVDRSVNSNTYPIEPMPEPAVKRLQHAMNHELGRLHHEILRRAREGTLPTKRLAAAREYRSVLPKPRPPRSKKPKPRH